MIREVFGDGGHFVGGQWSIDKLTMVDESAVRAKVTVGMSVAAGSTVNSAGEQPVSYEAEKRLVIYGLSADRGSWLIDAIDLKS